MGETKLVITHLLGGCAQCRTAMEPLAQVLFFPGRAEAEGNGAEYDFPIFRAINQARRLATESERPEAVLPSSALSKIEEEPTGVAPYIASGLRSAEGCEALLAASRELRYQDPEAMVFLAALAVGVAERLDQLPQKDVADLRARAWAELGNARPVANDLGGAEAALERALLSAEYGSGDPLLLARLLDLTASLYSDQRRFDLAFQLLDMVYQIYCRHDERHLAGRALISKGVSFVLNNDPEEALRL